MSPFVLSYSHSKEKDKVLHRAICWESVKFSGYNLRKFTLSQHTERGYPPMIGSQKKYNLSFCELGHFTNAEKAVSNGL